MHDPLAVYSSRTDYTYAILLIFQKHKIDLVLQQEWFDARLIHESRPGGATVFLNGILHFREIWMPDVYFVKRDSFEENTIHPAQIALHIFANGTVQYILR